MITISKVKAATGAFIKVLRYGMNDIVTGDNSTPAGIDSKPVSGATAVFAQTSAKGEPVVLGYINNSDLTNPGEIRIYATDADGVEVFSVYLKNNGTIEIGGDADNMVRFNPLNTNFAGLVSDLNLEFGKIAVAINAIVPGSYTPALINRSISGAKIDEVKTL